MSSISLRLKKIILDRRIQPRVALSQDTINDYCEAHIEGDEFPNITIFDVRGKYYLADGWHRLEAAKKAKITDMLCDVIKGTRRDAIKFSLLANAKHGLNRSDSDKRKAVNTCIDDPEWSQQSARAIAKMCGASKHLVNTIYKERADKKANDEGGLNSTSKDQDTEYKDNSGGDTVPENTAGDDVKSGFDTSDDSKKTDKHESGVPIIPAGMILVEEHSYNEDMFNYKNTLDENAELNKIIESDDPVKEAAAIIKKINADFSLTKSRMTGLINEKNEALKMVRSYAAIIKKLSSQVKSFGAVEKF